MDEAAGRAWVVRVLGVALPDTPSSPELDSPQDLGRRLASVIEDVKFHGATQALKVPLAAAVESVKDHAPTAADWVGRLEDQLAEFIRDKRAEQVAGEVDRASLSARVGVVNFARMRLQLAAARSGYGAAVANLQTACAQLLETPGFLDDPRSSDPKTLGMIDDIGSRVPDIEDLAGDVEDLLDRMTATADPDARRVLSNEALDAIEDYRAALDADPLLMFMENTAAGAFPIHAALAGALADLAGALQA